MTDKEIQDLANVLSMATAVRLFDTGDRFFPEAGSQISEDARLIIIEVLRHHRSRNTIDPCKNCKEPIFDWKTDSPFCGTCREMGCA